MLRLLPLIAQCSFYACVFFKHIIGIYGKLKSLEIRPEDFHNTNQKTAWGFSDFHYLSTTMASDVTHIGKMGKLDRKTRKQVKVISKICYTDLKIYHSCLKLWNFKSGRILDLIYLLKKTSPWVNKLAFQR